MRTITSERLVLRPWRDDDADFLLDLQSRWEVMRFLGTHPQVMRTREEALASIAQRRALDHPVQGVWVITTLTDGRPVGNVLLKPIPLSAGELADGEPDVEIGWHLHPDSWGNGYATEAASAVLTDALRHGLSRVVAVTYPENLPSQAVCRRLGMTHRGSTTRYYDIPLELFDRRLGTSAPAGRPDGQ